MSERRQIVRELTPVDDVRKVCAAIDQECEGDVYKVAARANEVTKAYLEKLNLKLVPVPAAQRRDGTQG